MENIEAIQKACALAGSQAELARMVGTTPAMMNQWVKGIRPVSDSFCAEIERVVKGAVTVEEISPSTNWHRIKDKTWPHPLGRPLIDPAKTEPAEKAGA